MVYIIMTRKLKKNDSQQFNQYQQNEHPPLAINHWIQQKEQHMTLEIKILAWDRHKKVKGVKPVNGHYYPLLL
jgi:hypothetical protein